MKASFSLSVFYFVHCLFGLTPVRSIEEAMCFGVSYNVENRQGLGPISMGASHWYKHPLNTFWAANHLASDLKNPDMPTLTITRVNGLDADGQLTELKGWLQLIISRPGKTIQAIAVWALNHRQDTIGEFMLTPPDGTCSGGKWHAPEFVPCSGAPLDAPLNPNMFIFTAKNSGKAKEHFYLIWKADVSFCNKPSEFHFMVALTGFAWNKTVSPFHPKDGKSKRLGPLLFKSATIQPKFYGLASPVFDKDNLVCNIASDSINTSTIDWFSQQVRGNIGPIGLPAMYHEDRWDSNGNQIQPNILARQVCRVGDGFTDFGGRCPQLVTPTSGFVKPTLDTPLQCLNSTMEISELNTMFERNPAGVFFDVIEYTKANRNPDQQKCGCPKIPTTQEVAAAKLRSLTRMIHVDGDAFGRNLQLRTDDYRFSDSIPYNDTDTGCRDYLPGTPSYNLLGLCLHSEAGEYALGARQWHALTNLFSCMVVVPISCFLARYLKGFLPISIETKIPYIPLRSWYFAHIFLVLPSVCLYTTSLSGIYRQIRILGHSRLGFSAFHRISGTLIMFVFGLQCLSGFLRPINMFWRKFAIYVHWICGYFLHYFGAVVCILTFRIPASPFSFVKIVDPKFTSLQFHLAPLLMLIWVFVDIIIHISVTMYVVNYDKTEVGVKNRVYFPVLLPPMVINYYLRTHDYEELPKEDSYLLKIFYGYCVFCFLSYSVVFVCMLYINTDVHQGYGPMECTHDKNNFFTAGVNASDDELVQKQKFCSI